MPICSTGRPSAPENIEHRQAHLVDMVISYMTRKPEPGDWTPDIMRSARAFALSNRLIRIAPASAGETLSRPPRNGPLAGC